MQQLYLSVNIILCYNYSKKMRDTSAVRYAKTRYAHLYATPFLPRFLYRDIPVQFRWHW